MRLSSVNLGRERSIRQGRRAVTTGIYKTPARETVRITYHGLAGDAICDTENHGGPDQAVYLYGIPDYEWWSETLERELPPGTFGENLTVSGLESARLCIGDRLHVGEAVLEVTAPRIPCATLAARMGDPAFVKRFRQAERPGLYCRVLREGSVRAGDPVSLKSPGGAAVPAVEIFRDFFDPEPDEARLRRYLAAPVAARARADMEARLEKLLARRTRQSTGL
jgi:MOSC domain-containing protein YiiM